MAAAARHPSGAPSDARVPCPLCGGLVHPVAGRCKHCKADLAAHRSARPAAAAALPQLGGRPAADPAPAPADHTPAPAPRAAPAELLAAPGVGAVLPPRPDDELLAAPRAWWRSWPVVVIVLAVIAIAVAVVMMVVPPAEPAEAGTRGRGLPPPPAPERMDTSPVPAPGGPQGQLAPSPGPPPGPSVDPWSAPAPDRNAAPPPGTVPRQVPPDPDPADPRQDPFANPYGGLLGGPDPLFGGVAGAQAYFGLAARACKKLASCSPDLGSYCALIDQISDGKLPSCAAAQRCAARIDAMSCGNLAGGTAGDLAVWLTTITECIEVASC